jgi:hypothetical protein
MDMDGVAFSDCSGHIVKAKSERGGFGAFATIDIEADTELGVYRGRKIVKKEGELWVSDRQTGADGGYSLSIDDFILDASDDREYGDSFGRTINHSFFANAFFDSSGVVVTKANVAPGEEITVDYGPSYPYNGFERIDVDWQGLEKQTISASEFFRTHGAPTQVVEDRYLELRLHVLGWVDRKKKQLLDSAWAEINKV